MLDGRGKERSIGKKMDGCFYGKQIKAISVTRDIQGQKAKKWVEKKRERKKNEKEKKQERLLRDTELGQKKNVLLSR